MQIVIDIDDEYVLSDIKNRSLEAESETDKVIINALYNGIPLPKHHGRLIDAREYENDICKHYFDNSTVIRCTEIALENAPTIIEADKEDKNE